MSWTVDRWSAWPGDREELDSLIRATGFAVWGRVNGKPITNMPADELEALAEQLFTHSRPAVIPAPKPKPVAETKPKRKYRRSRKKKGD